jgi:hypothetical protein
LVSAGLTFIPQTGSRSSVEAGLEGFVDINVSVSGIRRATGSTSLLRARSADLDIPNRVNEKPYSPVFQGLRAKR